MCLVVFLTFFAANHYRYNICATGNVLNAYRCSEIFYLMPAACGYFRHCFFPSYIFLISYGGEGGLFFLFSTPRHTGVTNSPVSAAAGSWFPPARNVSHILILYPDNAGFIKHFSRKQVKQRVNYFPPLPLCEAAIVYRRFV